MPKKQDPGSKSEPNESKTEAGSDAAPRRSLFPTGQRRREAIERLDGRLLVREFHHPEAHERALARAERDALQSLRDRAAQNPIRRDTPAILPLSRTGKIADPLVTPAIASEDSASSLQRKFGTGSGKDRYRTPIQRHIRNVLIDHPEAKAQQVCAYLDEQGIDIADIPAGWLQKGNRLLTVAYSTNKKVRRCIISEVNKVKQKMKQDAGRT